MVGMRSVSQVSAQEKAKACLILSFHTIGYIASRIGNLTAHPMINWQGVNQGTC